VLPVIVLLDCYGLLILIARPLLRIRAIARIANLSKLILESSC